MHTYKKLFQKFTYDLLSHKIYLFIFSSLICATILGFLHLFEVYLLWFKSIDANNINAYTYEPIDVVYTWVNGSDPVFIETMKKYSTDKLNLEISRFDDKSELKYSLRSIEKYAPWIRNIYIVTNGQIPSWLDLQCNNIKIITHDELAPDADLLPTFSSPAIETFIHNIPNLSKYFLYLNDDFFFGAPVWPDDFRTYSRGIRLFTAWNTPDCALDCSWSYIGDNACDPQCNTSDCQFDGGDCLRNNNDELRLSSTWDHSDETDDQDLLNVQIKRMTQHNQLLKQFYDNTLEKIYSTNINSTTKNKDNKNDREDNISDLTEEEKSLINDVQNQELLKNVNTKNLLKNIDIKNSTSDKKLLQFKNDRNLTSSVQKYNESYLKRNKLIKRKGKLHGDTKRINNNTITHNSNRQYIDNLDNYAKSLIHTNKIFNIKYGFKNRRVPSHVPLLINRDIINQIQIDFRKELMITMKNKFRSSTDFQFGFSYYHYIMSETNNLTVEEIFNQLDTDNSGTWSDRELRTLLARVSQLPLEWGLIETISATLRSCGEDMDLTVTTPVNERYIDSDIPTITKELVINCLPLREILLENFSLTNKFKFELVKHSSQYYTFQMLTSNNSVVISALDEIRKHPKKFVCINDNLDPNRIEDNELIRSLLEDFYISLFPIPSKYELPIQFRNRFLYISELNKFSYKIKLLKLCIYALIIFFIPFTFYKLCGNNKYKRRKYLIV